MQDKEESLSCTVPKQIQRKKQALYLDSVGYENICTWLTYDVSVVWDILYLG